MASVVAAYLAPKSLVRLQMSVTAFDLASRMNTFRSATNEALITKLQGDDKSEY